MASDRIVGFDLALRSSGIAVVEVAGASIAAVEYRLVKNPPSRPVSECLLALFRGVSDVLHRCRPSQAAVEGVFFCRNVKTAIALGQARGAAIAACAMEGVPVSEYSPRRVKQAVVGFGAAGKSQVQRMVMALLRLREQPHPDAADALAIAICHAHAMKRWNFPNSEKL